MAGAVQAQENVIQARCQVFTHDVGYTCFFSFFCCKHKHQAFKAEGRYFDSIPLTLFRLYLLPSRLAVMNMEMRICPSPEIRNIKTCVKMQWSQSKTASRDLLRRSSDKVRKVPDHKIFCLRIDEIFSSSRFRDHVKLVLYVTIICLTECWKKPLIKNSVYVQNEANSKFVMAKGQASSLIYVKYQIG